MINLMFRICYIVFLDFMNPTCSSANINSACGISRFIIILKSILLGCEIRLNVRKLEHFVESPFLGMGMIRDLVN